MMDSSSATTARPKWEKLKKNNNDLNLLSHVNSQQVVPVSQCHLY